MNLTPAQAQPTTLSESERWYAAHTLPFAETRAERQRQEYRTFQPKRHKTIRHAPKLSTVEAPFFPGYLFIVLDLTRHQWRSVNSTVGVSRLVMCGDRPHPAPPSVVEALIEAADARGVLQLGSKLRSGGAVRLIAGPFRCSKSNRSPAAADAAGWSGARWPWYFAQICTLDLEHRADLPFYAVREASKIRNGTLR